MFHKNRFQINEVVGLRRYYDHAFGRVVLGQLRPDGMYYLLDEAPHAISDQSESGFLVANATYWGQPDDAAGRPQLGPGWGGYLGWWKESKLKKRKPGTVCKCKNCERYRRRQKRKAKSPGEGTQ